MRTATALRAFVVVASWAAVAGLAISCSKESPQAQEDAAAPKTCPAGSHVATNGSCAPNLAAPPPMPEEGASASASASGSAATPQGRCPDPAYADRVATFDWEKEMGAEAPLAAKLRTLTTAGSETKALAAELELEVRGGCARIATLLGAKGPFPNADVACQAANDAIRDTKAKIGAGSKIAVHVHQPVCGLSLDLVAECTKKCADPGESPAEPSCDGSEVDHCTGTCDGTCELRAPAKCDGTCNGRCESGFTGTCTGTCKGTCNGKDMKKGGTCAGKCEGTCEGNAKGECKGRCDGACQGKTNGCPGLCNGKCSVAGTDRRCSNWVKEQGVSAGCLSACATRALRKATCSMPVVAVTVDGAKDATAGAQLERALEAGLGMIARADRQLHGHVDLVSKNQGVVSDASKAVAQSGSSSLPQVTPCLGAFEHAVGDGASSLSSTQRAASSVLSAAK